MFLSVPTVCVAHRIELRLATRSDMTDTTLRCAACGRSLGSDDRFCPQCGEPTPLNVDPDATLVDPGSETTLPDPAASAPGGGQATANFKDRLRQILGGGYELLSLIGQGGFARVYRARDRRLDRIVAIKVIRPDVVGNHAFVESFRSEGVALAKLRHPGIVPIYDIRERDGLIYYVMPYVEGTTLEARLERVKLPPFETRRILSELADALNAAHRAKVAHLDIKPGNIFLEGDLQKVLLMDFGIAMALKDQVDEASRGSVMGTPEYMSPEQARGLPDIDHRSDIYSLGALGYRMLIGRTPFLGKRVEDTLTKHVTEAPVPIRDINPTIPRDFADAIMRCLEKDPWKRFSTAMELRAVLEGVKFSAPRESAAQPVSTGMKGSVAILVAGAALLVGLLVGLALR
jgi:serine/threonine-protein kinase